MSNPTDSPGFKAKDDEVLHALDYITFNETDIEVSGDEKENPEQRGVLTEDAKKRILAVLAYHGFTITDASPTDARRVALEEALQIAVKRAQYHADILNNKLPKDTGTHDWLAHSHRANEAKEIADAIRALPAKPEEGK